MNTINVLTSILTIFTGFYLFNLKDEEVSKDIVQDTFERLWKKVETVDFAKSKSYLFTTAYHLLVDYTRRNKRFSPLETDEEEFNSPVTVNEFNNLKQILNEAASKLPEIQRSVLLLRDYEGYNYEEIGNITGLTESQVKVYIFRARQSMRKYIGCIENVI